MFGIYSNVIERFVVAVFMPEYSRWNRRYHRQGHTPDYWDGHVFTRSLAAASIFEEPADAAREASRLRGFMHIHASVQVTPVTFIPHGP